jgi:hypothetical protein
MSENSFFSQKDLMIKVIGILVAVNTLGLDIWVKSFFVKDQREYVSTREQIEESKLTAVAIATIVRDIETLSTNISSINVSLEKMIDKTQNRWTKEDHKVYDERQRLIDSEQSITIGLNIEINSKQSKDISEIKKKLNL